MTDQPLFDVPDDRKGRRRPFEHWGPWRGERTTCDDCALLIGTKTARHPIRNALYALNRVDGTIGAYCTPHARERGCRT